MTEFAIALLFVFLAVGVLAIVADSVMRAWEAAGKLERLLQRGQIARTFCSEPSVCDGPLAADTGGGVRSVAQIRFVSA